MIVLGMLILLKNAVIELIFSTFRAIPSPRTWSLNMQIPINGQQSSLVRDSS